MNRLTLDAIAARGKNSFNLVRLLAAAAVIVSHAFYITNGKALPEPLAIYTDYPLGAHAVNVFFALSGFMIAASWHNNPSLIPYAAARALRLYPALIVSALMTFALGGLITTAALTEYYSASSFAAYFGAMVIKLTGTATLPGLFEQLPGQHFVNEPIWTLKYEAACYIALPVVLVLGSRLPGVRSTVVLAAIAVAAGVAMTSNTPYVDATKLDHLARMGFAFFTGAFAWHVRDRIALSWNVLALMTATAFVLAKFAPALLPPAMVLVAAYGAALVASVNFGWLTRATDSCDLSYGIYVFGWPVQQTLVLTGLGATATSNAAGGLLLAALCAFASWHLVEKQALKLRRLVQSGVRAPGVAVSGP